MDPDTFDLACFALVLLLAASLVLYAGIRLGIAIGRTQRRVPSTRIRTVHDADPLGTILAHRIRLGNR